MVTVLPAHILTDITCAKVIGIEPVSRGDNRWLAFVANGEFHLTAKSPELIEVLLASRAALACWDIRRVPELCTSDDRIIWDTKSVYGGDVSLSQLCRKLATPKSFYERYLQAEQRMMAHRRALKTARISGSAMEYAPQDLVVEWVVSRTHVITRLQGNSRLQDTYVEDYERRWPFIRALREVELNGIHVDRGFIDSALREGSEVASERALRSMQGLERGEFVTSLLNPIGAKTGRLRHEGGFNTLGIPKGPARQAITSRWDGGKIVSIDFNAIDYRSIVNSVGGEFAKLYADAKDFHQRTLEFLGTPSSDPEIFKLQRDTIKYLSYITIYGGSLETICERLSMSEHMARGILERLEKRLGPIKTFREWLWMKAQEDGCIEIPGGRVVNCSDADNPGKVVGLYAQSYSSWVFEQAFTRIHRRLRSQKSCVVFSVHDEVVIDCHPDELSIIDELVALAEFGGYKVKVKIGENYGAV